MITRPPSPPLPPQGPLMDVPPMDVPPMDVPPMDAPLDAMPPEPALSPPRPREETSSGPIFVPPPYFRRIPPFTALCPPEACTRKVAIGVFNGVLRASMKLLV